MENENVTILSSNCLGGLLYHELGLQFLSPTVNVRFSSPEFVKFIVNIEHYLNAKLEPLNTDEPYPVAMLDDIKIRFVHYHSFDDAVVTWEKRKKRIVWERCFVILNDCDFLSENDLTMLQKSKFRHICVFSAKPYEQYRFCFYLPCFAGRESVGNLMKKSFFTGEMKVEKAFDFVGWFKQEKGPELEAYRRGKYKR